MKKINQKQFLAMFEGERVKWGKYFCPKKTVVYFNSPNMSTKTLDNLFCVLTNVMGLFQTPVSNVARVQKIGPQAIITLKDGSKLDLQFNFSGPLKK